MKQALIVVGLILIALFFGRLFRDNSEEDYRYGYIDGNSTGYNAACKFPIYPVLGDWDNENYSRGYREGLVDGAAECADERENR